MGEEIVDPQIDEIISNESNVPDAEPETEQEQQIPEHDEPKPKKTRKVYEKKPKLPDKKRIAHCLGCGNEWLARTGNNKNPSKCTICGSRRCIWKDEMDDSIKDFIKEKHEEQHEEPEKEEKIEPIGENKMEQQSLFDDVLYGEEKPMPPMPKIPIKTIAIMLGVVGIAAAVYFLVIKRKRNNRKNDSENEEEEERKYPILPGLGGL